MNNADIANLILYKNFYRSMEAEEIKAEAEEDGLFGMTDDELETYRDKLVARKQWLDSVLPPHSGRVYAEVWQNGSVIETLVYADSQTGEDFSDRIHLMITDQGGVRQGWLMNEEDAIAVIRGLEIGIKKYREIMGEDFNGVVQ